MTPPIVTPTSQRAFAADRPGDGDVLRWVAPVGAKIPRTPHGLLDSAALGSEWYLGDQPRPSDELVGVAGSYVLLAPGGAGKTTLVDALQRRERDSTAIDLRMHDSRSLAEAFDQLYTARSGSAASAPTAVFIDALDEALHVDPNIEYVLLKLLSRPGTDQLAWRFACRPGSWTRALDDGMRAALIEFEALELLPLGYPQIHQLAAADADDFLRDVERADLTRLLASPLHASNLLDVWRRSGRLPAARSMAMQHAVDRMLDETSVTRMAGSLDAQRRQLIAERLAALSTFCGVRSYSVRSGGQVGGGETSLAVTSVPTHSEPDLAGAALTVADVREVIGAGLFTAAGQGAVTFVHQAYAEFLAAAYLRRRNVAGRRLVALLGADVNGLVPGAMIDVLGWLLAMGASVPGDLVASNARALLSTAGLALADARVRRGVVQALLDGAAAGTVRGISRADTSVLAHPELAAQLREAAAGTSNPWQMFWACRITRQCEVDELADEMLAVALEPTWPEHVRAEAVTAFGAVAPRARMHELAPLLHLDSTQDPRDEILAAVLRAMLPDAVDFDLLRHALRPRHDEHYIGNYDRLLGELATLLPADEVLPTLTAALSRLQDHSDTAFDDVVLGLLRRAWEARDAATATTLGTALADDRLGRRSDLPWSTGGDPELRRIMAVAALEAHDHAIVAVLDLRMLAPSDVGWLIDWLAVAEPESDAASRAGHVLHQLAWNVGDAATADRILSVDDDHPAAGRLGTFRGAVDTSSRPRFWRGRSADGHDSVVEDVATLRAAIDHSRTMTADWWQAATALAGSHGSLDWDLKGRPLWSDLSSTERDEFLATGIAYLDAKEPGPDRWVGRNELAPDVFVPDWAGAHLVATLAVHHPELLAGVAAAAWAAWVPVVTAMSHYSDGEPWMRPLRAAAPDAAREAIDAALREQVRGLPQISFAHHPLADFTDTRLIAVVEHVARSVEETAERRTEALGVLVEQAPDVALDAARAMVDGNDVPAAAFTTLGRLAPEELIGGWFDRNRLGPLDHLAGLDVDLLTDDSLVTLTGLLLDELPFDTDPEELWDYAERTPEAVARRLRGGLLQAMAGRGLTAALVDLEGNRPAADRERIQQLLPLSRAREAAINWRPLEPITLMDLMASGDARLIRDNASLLTVLLEQLDLIQHDLQQRTTFRSLWDGEPGRGDASPKGEDTISDWLVDQLRLRLQPYVVLDREIQVARRANTGFGTRIDITASAGGAQVWRVIFEAKMVANPELSTALKDQLVHRYMVPEGLTHGIYIVYWMAPELRTRSRGSHLDATVLADELREQATQHAPDRQIDVVILDIGPPPSESV